MLSLFYNKLYVGLLKLFNKPTYSYLIYCLMFGPRNYLVPKSKNNYLRIYLIFRLINYLKMFNILFDILGIKLKNLFNILFSVWLTNHLVFKLINFICYLG